MLTHLSVSPINTLPETGTLWSNRPTPCGWKQRRDAVNGISVRRFLPLVDHKYSTEIAAYFTQATVDQLGTIDDIQGIAELVVPEGTFQSTRVSKSRKGDDSRVRSDVLKSTSSSVTRTYAPFPSPYPVQSTPYPALPSTFTQECCSPGAQSSHNSPYCSPSEVPQFSVPPPMPPMASSNPSLPPIRSGVENIDYKMRRPSLPTMLNCSPDLADRRASADYSVPLDSSCISNRVPHHRDQQGSLPSSAAHHGNSFSSAHDRGAEFTSRNALPCSYDGNSSRSSPAPYHGSPAGSHQPLHRSQDDVTNVNSPYAYSPHTAYPTHGTSQISLPPPAQLFRPEPPSQLIEVTTPSPEVPVGIGPCRVDLAPLHSLQRSHPYRRDPVDDKTLRLLGNRG